MIGVSGPSDKESTQTQDQIDMTCTEWPELVFHPVDEDWQRVVCAVVSVPVVRSNRTHSGDATVVLRHHTETIRGADGNCLNQYFSYTAHMWIWQLQRQQKKHFLKMSLLSRFTQCKKSSGPYKCFYMEHGDI